MKFLLAVVLVFFSTSLAFAQITQTERDVFVLEFSPGAGWGENTQTETLKAFLIEVSVKSKCGGLSCDSDGRTVNVRFHNPMPREACFGGSVSSQWPTNGTAWGKRLQPGEAYSSSAEIKRNDTVYVLVENRDC